jgi:hypothetical protein
VRYLRAGALSAELHGADLRRVRLGRLVIIQRLHFALRDLRWRTPSPDSLEVDANAAADGFRVAVRARYGCLECRALATGEADGTITLAVEATAGAALEFNRFGICLLLPSTSYRGRPFCARTAVGAHEGRLPLLIGPQQVVDDTARGLFAPFRRLTLRPTDDITVEATFAGDWFELEDQRNWGDGSFKAYGPPQIPIGRTHRLEPGERSRQRATVRTTGESARGGPADDRRDVTLHLGGIVQPRLPRLGLSLGASAERLAGPVLDGLRALTPDHLRVELRTTGAPPWTGVLEAAVHTCAAVRCELEVALLGTLDESWLQAVGQRLAAVGTRLARILVLGSGNDPAPAGALLGARDHLAHLRSTLVAGTNGSFAEVNRIAPFPLLTGVAFGLTPQVHASDPLSMVEGLEAIPDLIASARARHPGPEVVVSPITLRPPDAAPDPRQRTPLAGAWAAGAVTALAAAGATSMTFFEVAGARGVMSIDGERYPALEALITTRVAREAPVLECRSSAPHRVVGLAQRLPDGIRVVAVNLTSAPVRVSMGNSSGLVVAPPLGVATASSGG